MGKFDEAILMFDVAIKINPNDGKLYYTKGIGIIYILRIFPKRI